MSYKGENQIPEKEVISGTTSGGYNYVEFPLAGGLKIVSGTVNVRTGSAQVVNPVMTGYEGNATVNLGNFFKSWSRVVVTIRENPGYWNASVHPDESTNAFRTMIIGNQANAIRTVNFLAIGV